MKYTDLIFDLYGTLVDITTVESSSVWNKTALYFSYYGAGYTGKELQREFKALLREKESAAGQGRDSFPDIPIESVLEELFTKKAVTENTAALGLNAAQLFRISSTKYVRLYPGVREALKALREKGFRLWLLSNAQRVFTEYELRALGLTDCFDGIYISSDYGFRKPDLRFFSTLIEDNRLKPQNCLMIGNDRETDIAGAKNAGLNTLYMHTNISPPGQAEASPALSPTAAPAGSRHYEYEGSNWNELAHMIISIAKKSDA